jgi:raffinose/stachyose/melibiose transport system substrate-binding protein
MSKVSKILSFVLVTIVLLGTVGCSTNAATTAAPADASGSATTAPAAGGKVLKFWHWEGEATAQSQSWDAAMKIFQEKHPDVTIQFERKTFDGMQQNMQMILNSDDVPDVTELNKGNATAGLFSKSGLLTDLTDASKLYGWEKILSPSIQTTCRYDDKGLMNNNGKLYGITTYGEFIMVYYNKDMFKKYNLSVPTTYEEFQNVSETFIKNGVQPMIIGGSDKWTLTHNWQELLLYKADRELINNFQFLTGDVDFHGDAFTYATTEFQNQLKKGYYGSSVNGTTSDDASMAFTQGKVPMYLSGSWSFGGFMTSVKDFDWDIFLMPGKKMTTGSGGNLFVVPAKAKNKELAFEFMNVLLSQDVQTVMANTGGIPVNADTSKITDAHVKTLNEAFASIVKNDGLAFYPDWPVPGLMDVEGAAMQDLVSGAKTPDQVNDAIKTAYEEGKANAK